MGYSTDFTGQITINPPLNPTEIDYLTRFANTRRMQRDKGPYFVDGDRSGLGNDADVTNYNAPPEGQPGLWCQWVPTGDGTALEWDGVEKFYDSVDWMRYLIDTFLKPGATLQAELAEPVEGRVYPPEFAAFTFDHVLNGAIEAQGEDADDRWDLVVEDNGVARRLPRKHQRPVRIQAAEPFASNPGEPTLDMDFPTTPGFRTGATVSIATARELAAALQAKLAKLDAATRDDH
jgi:hypothetical protein